MRPKPVTVPVTPKPAWWKGNPKPPTPRALGDCPAEHVTADGDIEVCGQIVYGLTGSPRLRPHVVCAVPCGHWLDVDTANDIENGAWI